MSDHPSFRVEIEAAAQRDIRAVAHYLATTHHPDTASKFIADITARIDTLERFPSRGSEPKELAGANSLGYRQLVFGPSHPVSD